MAALAFFLYVLPQREESDLQHLITEGRYSEAVKAADRKLERGNDPAALSVRAEASKLLGNFEEAIRSYRSIIAIDSRDPSPREGLALSLAHLGGDLPEARRILEETSQNLPAILEFQALELAYVLLKSGERESALELFEDNLVLLQTRFEMDYTDPDPLMVETLFLFAELSAESGDHERARMLYRQCIDWAPKSIFAKWAADKSAAGNPHSHSSTTI